MLERKAKRKNRAAFLVVVSLSGGTEGSDELWMAGDGEHRWLVKKGTHKALQVQAERTPASTSE